MKTARRILVCLAVVLALTAPALATGKMTPEEAAKAFAQKQKKALGLSDEQAAKVEAANLDFAKKAADLKATSGGDKAKMKAGLKDLQKSYSGDLEKILTPEQYTKYKANVAAAAKKAKEAAAAKAAAAAPAK